MKISVITATYNSAATVRDTIESVLAQDYRELEYIVVDGNSSDATPDIVRSYGSRITRFICEPDKGIYDALNKGIAHATGDIVALLHSDDVFDNAQVLSRVAAIFQQTQTTLLCTDVAVCREDDLQAVVRYYSCTRWRPWMFRIGHQPPHPGFFARRSAYEKYGNFHLPFRISADFDLMLRFIVKHKLSVQYRPMLTVRMRDGGTSNAGFQARKKANREDHEALCRNGFFSFLPFIYLKYFIKFFQFFRKPQAV